MAAAEAPRSSGSADSYLGCLISLTSKSEIRYEGVLFDINTEESSIGLSNVRSFGTEGRKKDGPQLLPSDKIYEYILFRGSDIKDLQVKSSPPVQTTPMHYDPAIIQSHYPQAATASTNVRPSGTGSIPDLGAHSSQVGLSGPTLQASLPLYQPSGSLGSWGSSLPPPTTNVNGLAMPMYWQGYYGAPGFPAQQQSLLRPPPGLSMPPSMQQTLQYPATSASLPSGSSHLPASPLLDSASSLLPPFTLGTLNPQSSLLPAQSSTIVPDSLTTLITSKAPAQSLSTATLSTSLPFVSPLTSGLDKAAISSSISEKPKVPSPVMPFTSMSESVTPVAGTPSSILNEGATPSLVTPGQLLQSGPVSSSQPLQTAQRDVQVVQVSSSELSLSIAATEAREPILPLPLPSDHKLHGAPTHYHSNRGGRERGRGNGIARPVNRFTEEFDFIAMNEKFNKDEVWDDLGKSNRTQEDGDDSQAEVDVGVSNNETKPVYVKDDFFDSLSCDALDRESRNGRTKFSDQLRKDSETFGYLPRPWGGRGPYRGGRSRGGYYGRGYGYGYVGRGRGHSYQGRPAW
ncbi:hypothetical protein FH972_007956 [Carpinus fangiana]|uniref:DFDF domain-containing protein n=1 Tax=Carpinus fangiana TaxID=176857 RepID=A0A5N6QX96_9ROSI|nr:hypothetical protein FH972_007956 [Carpinus fangiana]